MIMYKLKERHCKAPRDDGGEGGSFRALLKSGPTERNQFARANLDVKIFHKKPEMTYHGSIQSILVFDMRLPRVRCLALNIDFV